MFSSDPEVAKRQMLAVAFMLTSFGHIDGKFGMAEKRFVQEKIAALVENRMLEAVSNPLARHAQTERVTAQFQRVAAAIDREIVSLLSESVAEGESQEQFVFSRITLRCYELLKTFEESAREVLFEIVDDFILADGVAHPNEERLKNDLKRLLSEPRQIVQENVQTETASLHFRLEPEQILAPKVLDYPFFTRMERAFPRDPEHFGQIASADVDLVRKVRGALQAARERGAGRLGEAQAFPEFSGTPEFLDGHVYVIPPKAEKEYELIVLGDLHGCYSCLKAALMQTDFLAKVQAHHNNPESTPDTRLILLGDYIDRGHFSYDGIMRTIMQLYVAAPHAVHILRGNHEYYIEHKGRILAPVRPAEGMINLEGVAADAFFKEYMQLFEELPTTLAFDRLFFTHAGIPRDATLRDKWKGLSTLNDPDVRFEMMWSDPSDAEAVPDELQKAAARFGYGTAQFRSFMTRIGCSALLRGHERIIEGFRTTYEFPEASLYTLFSAGGENCRDLPETSNYREVTPRALSIRHKDGVSRITPFVLDWAHYNDPSRNRFFA